MHNLKEVYVSWIHSLLFDVLFPKQGEKAEDLGKQDSEQVSGEEKSQVTAVSVTESNLSTLEPKDGGLQEGCLHVWKSHGLDPFSNVP